MKKLFAIAIAALLLTASVPVQCFAEDITENVEIIKDKEKTILRAGNLEYELHTSKNPDMLDSVTLIGVIDRTVESIELPASVNGYPVRYPSNENDPDIFWHCDNLKEIRVDPDNTALQSIDGVLFDKNESILYAYPRMKEGDYVIPDGTRFIWNRAFYKTQKLGVVTVPDSVVDISGAAFAESSVTDFVGALPILHGTAVKNCKNLRSLSIRTPLGGSVANAWFTGLSSLESLTFSPDVIVQENLGLIDCPLLKHVEFPQTLPSNIFSDLSIANCDSLETVTLYNSMLSGKHGDSFIRNCPKLREITVEQIPYVYSNLPLELEQLPALERVNYKELPKSAVAGTSPDDDPVYHPLMVGAGCADFTVAGREENVNLQNWCKAHQITFSAIGNSGDVSADEIIQGADGENTILRAGNVEYELQEASDPTFMSIVTFKGLIDENAESVFLPASVNGYPVYHNYSDSFSIYSQLKEINVHPDNEQLKSVDGVLFSKDGQSLYAYPPAKAGDYVIPEGTRIIDNGAFNHTTKLETVTVSDSLAIVNSAFYDSSVTEFIGSLPLYYANSLNGCDRLRTVTIRECEDTPAMTGYFRDLPSLESLTFEPNVLIRESLAVIGCPKLKTIDFPQSDPDNPRSSIVVSDCASLESVSFYNSCLLSHDNTAGTNSIIKDCPALREITIRQIPYVYSEIPLELEQLPALERVNYKELPKSAVAGTSPDDDPVYDPLMVGAGCADFTVAGYAANVNLQEWCAANQIAFENLAAIQGDANLDGELNIMDVIVVNKFILGTRKLDDTAMKQADMNSDGNVTSEDSLEILKAALGITD